MTTQFNHNAAALASYQLSVQLFLRLRGTAALPITDANEAIEQALLGLEQHQALADSSTQETFELARAMLAMLR